MLFSCLSVSALAAEQEVEGGQLLASYYVDNAPVEGVQMKLYRVGTWNNHNELTWVAPFDGYRLKFYYDDNVKLGLLTDTLCDYIVRDDVKPLMQAETDKDGVVVFTGLESGVYLVMGESYTVDDYTYIPRAALAAVDEWTPVEIEIKHDTEYHPPKAPTVSRHVIKVWSGDSVQTRPSSIDVQLLRNGKVYDTQTLSRKNDWRYSWKDLDPDYSWTVVEKTVPIGYSVDIELKGLTFVITNIKDETPDQPDEPVIPDNPNIPDDTGTPDIPNIPDEPNIPDDANIPDTPNETEQPSGPRIPQTGMSWGPAVTCCILGIVFVLLAAVFGRRRKAWVSLLILSICFIGGAFYMTWSNVNEEQTAGTISELALNDIEQNMETRDTYQLSRMAEYIPDYILDPTREMPVVEEDGEDYVCVLDIPVLDLHLPVISELSYPALKKAPCRYEGSAYTDDLIIGAHNYKTHFGTLKVLEPGDEILLTDMDGNQFHYEVSKVETLDGGDLPGLESGDWDMTLFTCTIGGVSRVTVRCDKVS